MSFVSIAGTGAAKTLMAVTVSLHPGAAHHSSHQATVRAGDTLSSISQSELGKAADWPALWWANRHTVHNPSLIQAGQKLVVPDSAEVKPWLMRAALAAIPAAAPVRATPVASSAPASRPRRRGAGCCAGQQRVLQRRVGQLPELRDPGGERRERFGGQPVQRCGRPVRLPAVHLAGAGLLRAAGERVGR